MSGPPSRTSWACYDAPIAVLTDVPCKTLKPLPPPT